MESVGIRDRATELLAAQSGVAHVDQLRDAGAGWREVRDRIESGSWRRLSSKLIALSGELDRGAREWAAITSCGHGAALCGLSAAAQHGLSGLDDGLIHVAVPRGARPPEVKLPIKLHHYRRLDPAQDLDDAFDLPTTRACRSIVDAASWSGGARRACAVLVTAVQQGVCTADELVAEIATRATMRHRRIMMAIARAIRGGPDALAGVDLRLVARRHGLPRPREPVPRTDGDGRHRFLDIDVRSRRGKTWLIRVDAAVEMIAGGYWSEDRRPDDLILTDATMLYFPSSDLLLNEVAVATHLHRILND